MQATLLHWLERRTVAQTLAIAWGLVPVLGAVDYLSGPEISLSILYLLPIALAAWLLDRRQAIALALACAAVWYGVDRLSAITYRHDLVAVWNAGVRLGFFLIVTATLSALRAQLEHAREAALFDPLTDLANRRQFLGRAALELERMRRYDRELSLAYLDLDNFKAANDRHGHGAGDAILRVVAETLAAHVRSTDLVARLGGDEFAILFPDTGGEAAQAAVAKLERLLRAAMAGQGWAITFSIGVGTFAAPPAGVDEMVTAVDDLMYEVKASGKGAWRHRDMTAGGGGAPAERRGSRPYGPS